MKWLTGKNAQAFADINWQPDEEENEVEIVIVTKSDVSFEHMKFRAEDSASREVNPA